MDIAVEIFCIRLVAHTIFYLKHARDITFADADPDSFVADVLVGMNCVAHSTSWRYEAGSIILTYLAYSDDLNLKGGCVKNIPFDSRKFHGPFPSEKSGAQILTEEDVILHGMRHIAFLVRTDTSFAWQKALNPEILEKLKEIPIDVAGRLH